MIKNKVVTLVVAAALAITPAYSMKKTMSFEEQVDTVIQLCRMAYLDYRSNGSVAKITEILGSLDEQSAAITGAMCLSYSTGFEDAREIT